MESNDLELGGTWRLGEENIESSTSSLLGYYLVGHPKEHILSGVSLSSLPVEKLLVILTSRFDSNKLLLAPGVNVERIRGNLEVIEEIRRLVKLEEDSKSALRSTSNPT